MPMLRHPSIPSSGGLIACSSSQGSVLPGMTHTSSAISRAAGGSLAARASAASRTVAGTVSTAAARTSVTKSGLPPVIPCSPWEGRSARAASSATADSDKRRKHHSARARARQIADHVPERVPRADLVVAIGNREHRVRPVDAASQILEQIERCFVRPVHVFEYDQRLLALQFIEGGAEDGVADSAGIHGGQQRSLSLPGDVVQRREWPGREERITRAPQHPSIALQMRKLLQQNGLSDARLACHECKASAAFARVAKPFSQIREATFTLEQFHRLCTGRAWGALVVTDRLRSRKELRARPTSG